MHTDPSRPAPTRAQLDAQRATTASRLRSLTAGVAFAGVAATAGLAFVVSGPRDTATPVSNAGAAQPLAPDSNAVDPGITVPQQVDPGTGVQPVQPDVNPIQPPTRSNGRRHASSGGS